jgi:hypothetical protein
MKVRVLVQPTGLVNGVPWPEPGELYELDNDAAAEAMIAAGWLERVGDKVETRPSKAKAETRAG